MLTTCVMHIPNRMCVALVARQAPKEVTGQMSRETIIRTVVDCIAALDEMNNPERNAVTNTYRDEVQVVNLVMCGVITPDGLTRHGLNQVNQLALRLTTPHRIDTATIQAASSGSWAVTL